MAKRRSTRRITVKSRGSVPKRGARSAEEIVDERDWTVGMIAWNQEGNVVILDPRLGQHLRAKAREDGKFAMGISPVPVRVGSLGDEGSIDPLGSLTGGPKPIPINALCVCDYLRFRFEEELSVRTKLLSTQKIR
jgi:hypothetical protein